MPCCAESLATILGQPLRYVHPQRLAWAPTLDTPALRERINRLLDAQLAKGMLDAALSPIACLWVNHWSLLPSVAELIGAWLAWPYLAEGGRLAGLSATQRQFAGLSVAPRAGRPALDAGPLPEQLQALGLGALLSLHEQVPQALLDRLALQFPLPVVLRQHDLPPMSLHATLLTLAIQHARFHPHSD